MENFYNLGISKEILSNLKFLKLLKPTPVQQQAIQPGSEGKDILAIANTGTGKTAAFGIPIIQRLNKNKSLSAIILTPTRELAVQVGKHIRDLMGSNIKIKSAVLIGGDSMKKQIQLIKQNPRIFIGTPGRINDHITRKTLNLKNINILVLDETDRMLDLGFIQQIQKIMNYLPAKKQTLLFTATLPKNIKNISDEYLFKPIKISVEKKENILRNIDHCILNIKQADKYEKLFEEVNRREGSILVFMKTKHSSKRIFLKLQKDGVSVNAIHGNVRQNKRLSILNGFRNQKFRVLVATDVAARGLDISHIEHVINYDLPQRTEDYIHRIGRTARAGKKGSALSFISENDQNIWKDINKLINPNHKKTTIKDKILKFKKKDFTDKKKKNNNLRNLKRKSFKSKNIDSQGQRKKNNIYRNTEDKIFRSDNKDPNDQKKKNSKSGSLKRKSFKSNNNNDSYDQRKGNNISRNKKEKLFRLDNKDSNDQKKKNNKSANSKRKSFKSKKNYSQDQRKRNNIYRNTEDKLFRSDNKDPNDQKKKNNKSGSLKRKFFKSKTNDLKPKKKNKNSKNFKKKFFKS